MAALPDAAADQNVTQDYMAELNNTISGFPPIIAPKISEEAKSNTRKAVENEITRVVQSIEEEVGRAVENTNFRFDNYVEQVGDLAETIVAEKVEELEAKVAEIKAKDDELRERDQQLQAKDNQLEQLRNTETAQEVRRLVDEAKKLKEELKELVGTEKLTPKEWLFFCSKMLIEFYVSAAEPLAARFPKKTWLKWSGLALAIVLFLMTIWEVTIYCIHGSVVHSKRVKWRRVRWIIDIYGLIMSVTSIVLFAVSFQFPQSLHIAIYACTFAICMLIGNCVRQFSKKQRAYEV